MPATYYVNAAGSNTAPYDTAPKGATSLGYLDSHVTFGNGDTVRVIGNIVEVPGSFNLFNAQPNYPVSISIIADNPTVKSTVTLSFSGANKVGINTNMGLTISDIVFNIDADAGVVDISRPYSICAVLFAAISNIQRCEFNISIPKAGYASWGSHDESPEISIINVASTSIIINNIINISAFDAYYYINGAINIGGGEPWSFATATVYNNTIYIPPCFTNSSGGIGAGYCHGNIKNNIIYAMNADGRGASVGIAFNVGQINVTNNCTFNCSGGDIASDPLFTNASTGDFSLQSGSPCKTAGIGHNSDSNVPTVDYNG